MKCIYLMDEVEIWRNIFLSFNTIEQINAFKLSKDYEYIKKRKDLYTMFIVRSYYIKYSLKGNNNV